MKEIREDSKRQDIRNTPQGVESNQYTLLEDEREYIHEINPQRDNNVKGKQSDFTKRIKKGAWVRLVSLLTQVKRLQVHWKHIYLLL